MIKFYGKKMTANKAAKAFLFAFGNDFCADVFNPSECSCFGGTVSEMPTLKEQEAFYAALEKQSARVAAFLGLDA